MKKNNHTEYNFNKSVTAVYNPLNPKIIKIITEEIKLPFCAKIMEVGCGRGALIYELYKVGFNNVWGCDLMKSEINLSKELFSVIADNFFVHNIYEYNLPSTIPHIYDLIISMEVLEHLYYPTKALLNINKWLASNGYLIVGVPYHGYLKNLSIALLNRFDQHFSPIWEEGGHIKFFSKKSLSLLIQNTGFEILKFYAFGRVRYLWKTMVILARKAKEIL